MAAFTIRIPDEMQDRIRHAAAEDKRSMNGEVEWLLESALSRRAILSKAVRHKDGDISNNELSNIEVVDLGGEEG